MESSSGAPHLRVLQLKVGSDDTCDTSVKAKVEEDEGNSKASGLESREQSKGDMKILLIDKEPEEFDPHEIATLLNERFLKR